MEAKGLSQAIFVALFFIALAATLGFFAGREQQREDDCTALGGKKVQSVCIRGTEIIRRW